MTLRRPAAALVLALGALLLFGWWTASSRPSAGRHAAAATRVGSFRSASVQAVLHYAVALPADYDSSPTRRYPVIYFLHGLPAPATAYRDVGWVASALAQAGGDAILIAPQGTLKDGADPEYTDRGPGRNWATALAVDLPRFVDAHYRTIANRSGRALVGISAGGYGAASLGLSRLGTFSVVESWSGYFAPTDPTGHYVLHLGSDAADAKASVHAQTAAVAARVARQSTFLGFYVGREDPTFLQENRAMDRELDAVHVPHAFAVYPGGHTLTLWKAHAVTWLRLALRHLASPR